MRLAGKCFCLLLAGVMVLLWTTTALTRTIYVSPDGNDLNDGSSWGRAKRSVTAALAIAQADDQIWVRYGVYEERITLKDGISLYGGFRGTEQTLSERPPFPRPSPDQYETVLDGEQGGSVVTTPASATQTYRLDGFTVCNGKSDYGGGLYCAGVAASRLVVANCTISGNTASEVGGGVFCYNDASPTLTDCAITRNRASHGGGVVCWYSSSSTLTDCTIDQNTADYGGGVYCSVSSSPTLTNCTISQNTAGAGGGVLCLWGSSPLLTYCTIGGNTARMYAGGVLCRGSSPTLTDCAISGNTARTNGGGVYCSASSSPTLTDCTISGNTASHGGGVSCSVSSSPTLTNCTITNNTAVVGAGVYCEESDPTFVNCVVGINAAIQYGGGLFCVFSYPRLSSSILSHNTALLGGAVCSASSQPDFTNCTIAHNGADWDGGAIASDGGGSVVNTLIAFNSSGIYYSEGAPHVFRHNCVWGNDAYHYRGMPDPTGTDGNVSADPLMVAGHLLPGSPCIDAGDDSVVGIDWKDLDDEPRIGGSQVDIGADELHAPIVQGWMTFSDYVGTPPLWVPFEVRAGSTEVKQILIDADGGFVLAPVPAGEFALSVKPLSYLRRTVDVDTRGGSVLGLQLELVNGDIDGDNEVTLFDFGRLVAAFGSMPNDENWDASADLDGDEEVTLFDFGILVRNFGEFGDD